jgi:hypothetical protein
MNPEALGGLGHVHTVQDLETQCNAGQLQAFALKVRRAIDLYYHYNGSFGEEFECYLDVLFELRFVKDIILFAFSTSTQHEATLHRQTATIEFEEPVRKRYKLDTLQDAEENLEEEINYWPSYAPRAQTNNPETVAVETVQDSVFAKCFW